MSLSTFFIFFFNDTSTTEIYTLSLHDALPISREAAFSGAAVERLGDDVDRPVPVGVGHHDHEILRSEEHTSELQSLRHLVCRLLLEKKKKMKCQRQQLYKSVAE